MKKREWQGAVFKPADKNALWVRVKVEGRWANRPTPYKPGEEAKAEAFLAEYREQLLAAVAAMKGRVGPVTVRAWAKLWLEKREDLYGDDARILRIHILPLIGDMLLSEVKPRHILEIVETWKAASRSIRNRYATLQSMFRDAAIRGLIDANPCILRRPSHLPPIEDIDSEWRSGARFRKREVELLVSPCEDIEPEATVCYGLLGLGALRHGELAALRWRHIDLEREPLGEILVANSYRRRRTKAGKTRCMPIHPVLAAMLAEWKLSGWVALIGRPPKDDDLVAPLPATRVHFGPAPTKGIEGDCRMRTRFTTWDALRRHLKALHLRHRGLHAFRRAFYSLAEADGADRSILYWGVHGRPADMPGQYGEADWRRLCGEVARLQLTLRPREGATVTPLLRPGEPQP